MRHASFFAPLALFGLSACDPAEMPAPADAPAGALDAAEVDAPRDAPLPYDGGGSLDRYPVSAEFPEGGTFDPTGGAFYVGSLGDGSVHRIDAATGADTTLFLPSEPGTWWTLGMDVDAAARRLWVCAMDDQRETTSETPPYAGWIWIFDLATGERTARIDLSSGGTRATCTDVVVVDGVGYVVDREAPRVHRVTEGGEVTLFVEDDLLSGGIVGQNAVVVLPDHSALLSLIYLPSRLVRIDLTDRSVRDVAIDGTFSDLTPALSGADGMTLSGDRLLVAFTSEVDVLTPTLADWSSVTSSGGIDVPAGMTDLIHTPGGDYLLNGQAVRFALGQDTDPFALVRFVP